MTDTVTTKISSPSPEQIALELMKLIASAEGKQFEKMYENAASRAWILSTYAQCRSVVVTGWKASDALLQRPVID